MANPTIPTHDTSINGHTVPLIHSTDTGNLPANAANTDWLLVKFEQFVNFALAQELKRDQHLDIVERVDEDNVYLCKYLPEDLGPIINHDLITHLALYPASAVPHVALVGRTPVIDQNAANERLVDPAAENQDMVSGPLSLVIGLHPNPEQSPQQILHELQTTFGAEHLDPEIHPNANLIRVRVDGRHINEIAAIDSVRHIQEAAGIRLMTVEADRVLGTNYLDHQKVPSTWTDIPWTGADEVVHVADTGFDKGDHIDVHQAFTGRVLAAVRFGPTGLSSDSKGHGTHVAGSVLGDLSQTPGGSMSDVKGTAPKAKLVSQALNFKALGPIQDLFTEKVILANKTTLPAPTIHTNSWGRDNTSLSTIRDTQQQYPYGPDDAVKVDQAMFDNPQLCILFAAGNDGTVLVKDPKDPKALKHQKQISAWASAKNSIVVGATYTTRLLDSKGRCSTVATSKGQSGVLRVTRHKQTELTPYSSRGPTMENHIGVDVVAPGSVILSARSRMVLPGSTTLKDYEDRYGTANKNNLLFSSGTSMATPAVAGCVACLRQAYRHTQTPPIPTGAMLKALIIHGAQDLKGAPFTNKRYDGTTEVTELETMTSAPNPFQGYGLVSITHSLAPLVEMPRELNGVKDGSDPDGTHAIATLKLAVKHTRLVVTLAYTDDVGPILQNIVTLKVKSETGKATGNPQTKDHPSLKPTDPLNPSTSPKFAQSNVTKIVVTNPDSGEYEISVDIKGKQPLVKYAVVWSVEK